MHDVRKLKDGGNIAGLITCFGGCVCRIWRGNYPLGMGYGPSYKCSPIHRLYQVLTRSRLLSQSLDCRRASLTGSGVKISDHKAAYWITEFPVHIGRPELLDPPRGKLEAIGLWPYCLLQMRPDLKPAHCLCLWTALLSPDEDFLKQSQYKVFDVKGECCATNNFMPCLSGLVGCE